MLPHTGMAWFDVLVCIISGGAAIGIAIVLPRHVHNQYRFWRTYFDFVAKMIAEDRQYFEHPELRDDEEA